MNKIYFYYFSALILAFSGSFAFLNPILFAHRTPASATYEDPNAGAPAIADMDKFYAQAIAFENEKRLEANANLKNLSYAIAARQELLRSNPNAFLPPNHPVNVAIERYSYEDKKIYAAREANLRLNIYKMSQLLKFIPESKRYANRQKVLALIDVYAVMGTDNSILSAYAPPTVPLLVTDQPSLPPAASSIADQFMPDQPADDGTVSGLPISTDDRPVDGVLQTDVPAPTEDQITVPVVNNGLIEPEAFPTVQ